MTFTVSRQHLDEILKTHKLRSNDLAGIDKLFGGADGYYWYHTLKQMAEDDSLSWDSEEQMRAAIQGHENATAAEDEVKPQALGDAHVAAIAALLREH
jgi:hypothetical protein